MLSTLAQLAHLVHLLGALRDEGDHLAGVGAREEHLPVGGPLERDPRAPEQVRLALHVRQLAAEGVQRPEGGTLRLGQPVLPTRDERVRAAGGEERRGEVR
eukprot:6833579-Pyramimonas_sp.AAC.1